MTLNIAVVTPSGAWFCSDCRLGRSDGRLESNVARKGFGFRWDSGVAWVTVAGFVPRTIGIDWYGHAIADLSRTASLADVLDRLHQRMSEAFVKPSIEMQKPITLAIGGYGNDGPFLAHIHNARKCENRFATFEIHRVEPRPGKPLFMMSGRWEAVHQADRDAIDTAFAASQTIKGGVRKLAAINRMASQRPEAKGTVSAACAVTYVYPTAPGRFEKWAVDALGTVSRRTN